MKRPLAEAWEVLEPHLEQMAAAWRNRMASMVAEGRRLQTLARLTPAAHREALRDGDFRAYQQALEQHAESLARQSVPAEHAIAALALYGETCMAFLEQVAGREKRHSLGLALLRLVASSQVIVAGVYSRWARESRDELHERLRRSEQRLRNFSMHLINISEQDRSRLSRDLHDEVGHNLLVLKLYMEMISLDLKEGKTQQGVQKLDEAVELTGQAIEGVRRLAFNLGPAILDEMGFVPSVRRYSRQFTARTGIKVKVESNRMPAALPSSYEVAFYRVFQGALSNVAAHAKARNVTVALGRRKDSLFMVIEDDGVGFDLDKKLREPGQAFGLMAMRQRIELLGGNIYAESHIANGSKKSDSRFGGGSARTPGPVPVRRRSGTRIEVNLPLIEFDASPDLKPGRTSGPAGMARGANGGKRETSPWNQKSKC